MKKLVSFFLCAFLLFSVFIPAYAVWPFTKPTATPAPLPEEQVNALTDCYFFFDPASNKYFLLFSLVDALDRPLSPFCTALISIRSQSGDLLYESKRSVTPNGYKYWPLFIDRSLYCAGIQIDANLINPCVNGTGTISCHVYNDKYFDFDTFTLSSSYLPKTNPATLCSLQIPDSPLELSYYSYGKSLQSKIRIDNVLYRFEPYFNSGNVELIVTFYGEKTFGEPNTTHNFYWKLYDSDGYLVESSTGFISGLSFGDKFHNDYITIHDLPAGDYTLELFDYK